MRERREDCGDGSDDTTEETEDHAGGRLYPDPALSLPAPSLSVRGDSLCPGEFAELGAPGVAAQGGNTSSYHVILIAELGPSLTHHLLHTMFLCWRGNRLDK